MAQLTTRFHGNLTRKFCHNLADRQTNCTKNIPQHTSTLVLPEQRNKDCVTCWIACDCEYSVRLSVLIKPCWLQRRFGGAESGSSVMDGWRGVTKGEMECVGGN